MQLSPMRPRAATLEAHCFLGKYNLSNQKPVLPKARTLRLVTLAVNQNEPSKQNTPMNPSKWNFTPARSAAAKAATDDRSPAWLLGGENPLNMDGTDAVKEESRAYERTISNFTFDRWSSHRSTRRYISHMKSLFNSSIIRGLAGPLCSVGSVSTLVCMYEDLLSDGVLPDWFPSFYLPTAPFDLTSFALALLLVFRTNTSYDRWLESSTVWSGIANRSRDTMRQVISHLSDQTGVPPLAAAMCRWVVAYARSLKAELVPDCDLEPELREILTPVEMKELMEARHRPSFALSVLTELSAAAALRESHRIRLDENLTFFEDAVGSCERILRTPIPLAYTRHTSRFMVIWLTALPLGLYETCGWGTIPLSVVVAFLLLGIDEIGVQIEEPFGLLPLENLCVEIEGDMYGLLQEATITKRTAAVAIAAAMSASAENSDGIYASMPNGLALKSDLKKATLPHIEWGEMYRGMDGNPDNDFEMEDASERV